MLANMTEMMARAVSENRIIPGFNVFGYEDAKMVIEVAEALNAPAILMTNRDAADFMDVAYYGALYGKMAVDAKVPVCIHLDHGHSIEEAKNAVDGGYTSVMFDGSSLPIDENIRIAKDIESYCRPRNVSLEVEVGCVAYNEPGKVVPERLTDVLEVVDMCRQAHVDCVAVAVGNVHKMTEQKALIDFERLERIRKACPVPLVIHGTSGIPNDQVVKMRSYGIGKMNIGTAVRMAFGHTLREYLVDNPEVFDRIMLMKEPMAAMKVVIKDKYNMLGWKNGESSGL